MSKLDGSRDQIRLHGSRDVRHPVEEKGKNRRICHIPIVEIRYYTNTNGGWDMNCMLSLNTDPAIFLPAAAGQVLLCPFLLLLQETFTNFSQIGVIGGGWGD